MKPKAFLSKIHLGETTVPLALLWLVLLSYGIFLGWFGFYGDDWSYVWYHHLLGWNGPGVFASFDRPLSAGFYNPIVALLGESPLPYHILNLILRWLSAVLLFWCLRLLWQDKVHQAALAAALFAVYPGFTQQPIAVEFILHFAVLDLFLLSLILMVNAQRRGKMAWVFTAGNLICSASMFWLEYFVGLEMLRPVFLWSALSGQGLSIRRRAWRTFLGWVPNLALLGAFLYWRVYVFTFNQSYKPTLLISLRTNPITTLVDLVRHILLDLKIVVLDAWRNVMQLPSGGALSLYIGLILISLVTLLLYLALLRRPESAAVEEDGSFWTDWAWQPILLGIYAMLAAGWVFWITGIEVAASFPWDRTTLSFMLGASLLVMGLVELLFRRKWRVLVLTALVSLAVGFHYQNALFYRAEWESTRSFYWQLAWRAPGLKAGTLVASDDIPLYRISDAGLNAPLNWTYAPGNTTHTLPYKFFDLTVRMGTEFSGMPGLKPGLEINNKYRALGFMGKTDDMLVFYYHPPAACLHVLAPADKVLPGLPQKVADTIHLSNPDQIMTDASPAAQPPAMMFPEPAHDWCFYYQKAGLAAQKGDWQQVTALAKECESRGLKPGDVSEWLPFIKGFAFTRDFVKSAQLSKEVSAVENRRPALCLAWKQVAADPAEAVDLKQIQSITSEMGCGS